MTKISNNLTPSYYYFGHVIMGSLHYSVNSGEHLEKRTGPNVYPGRKLLRGLRSGYGTFNTQFVNEMVRNSIHFFFIAVSFKKNR